MKRVIIALGSNLADNPPATVRDGWRCVVRELGLHGAHISEIRRSEPAEGARGGEFANAVGVGWSALGPLECLHRLQAVERAFGRDRVAEGIGGARPLDLDLIDHGGTVRSGPELTLPHPRAARRIFVLEPLAALLPGWRHPLSDRPIRALLAVLLLAGLLGTTGCHHEPPPSTPWRPTMVSPEPPPLVLNATPVTDSRAVDRFCDALGVFEGDTAVADLLLTAAGRFEAQTLAVNPGARLLAAHAIYRALRARELGKRFGEVRALVEKLVKSAPAASETRFSLAYLRWILVTAAADFGRRPADRRVLEDLVANLQHLADDYPRFDGPGGFDAQRIRTELAAMKARLERPVDLPDGPTATILPVAVPGMGRAEK